MKFYSRIISSLLCIVVYLSTVSFSANAIVVTQFPTTIKPVMQAKSNWCWAACSEIVGKSIYTSSTRDQYDVVRHVKHTQNDVTGSPNDVIAGCKYVSYNKTNNKEFMYVNRIYGGLLNFSEVGSCISKGVGITSILSVDGVSEHGVVICATQFIDGADGSKCNIDYIDPRDKSIHHCSYSDFCDGYYNGMRVVGMINFV